MCSSANGLWLTQQFFGAMRLADSLNFHWCFSGEQIMNAPAPHILERKKWGALSIQANDVVKALDNDVNTLSNVCRSLGLELGNVDKVPHQNGLLVVSWNELFVFCMEDSAC